MLGRARSLSPVYISLVIVALLTQVMLLTSLPNAFYNKLKHKYRLRVSPNQDKMQSDNLNKRVKLVDEVVYECDTNLPIRMLFILNAMPLLKENQDTDSASMRFASGHPIDLCHKLLELDKKSGKGEMYEGGGAVEDK